MTKIIEIKHLSKTFKIKEKEKGFKGSLKSIIKPKYRLKKAVNNINLSIDKGEIILTSSADELRKKESASIDEIFRRCFKC